MNEKLPYVSVCVAFVILPGTVHAPEHAAYGSPHDMDGSQQDDKSGVF